MFKIIGVVKHANALPPHYEIIQLDRGMVKKHRVPLERGALKVDQVVKAASNFAKTKRSEILLPSHIADAINEKEKEQNG